jgi:hypothetical protein
VEYPFPKQNTHISTPNISKGGLEAYSRATRHIQEPIIRRDLNNLGVAKTPKGKKRSNRYQRYKLLKTQRQYAPTRSMSKCGCAGNDVCVNVSKGGNAYYDGVKYCKSPHCVMCSLYRAQTIVPKIDYAINQIYGSGGECYFITFTIGKEDLREAKDILSKSLNLWRTSIYNKIKRKYGFQCGYIRSFDTTFRPKNTDRFHLHIHMILSVSKPIDQDWFLMESKDAWIRSVSKYGGDACLNAQKVEALDRSKAHTEYLTDTMKVAYELTSAYKTETKLTESVSLYGLLKRIEEEGNDQDIFTYRTFISVMKGTKATISSGIFKEYLKQYDLEDFDISDDSEVESDTDHSLEDTIALDKYQFHTLTDLHPTYLLDLTEDYYIHNKRQKEYLVFSDLIRSTFDIQNHKIQSIGSSVLRINIKELRMIFYEHLYQYGWFR